VLFDKSIIEPFSKEKKATSEPDIKADANTSKNIPNRIIPLVISKCKLLTEALSQMTGGSDISNLLN